ncbi:MAG: ABC transporter ATP-binding protein [Gammaproteobacteria bacterium]|nr:ABC transporter ATP-binding protein [Gammaproteobacteria bacterium]
MVSGIFNPFEELKTKSILETLSLIPRSIAFVFRASPFYFLVSNTSGFIRAGIGALLLWLGKVVIDRVIAVFGSEIDWMFVLLPMIAIVVVRVIRTGISSSSNFVSFMVMQKVDVKSQSLLLNKAADLDLAYYESPHYYDRLYQARSNIHYIQSASLSLIGLVSETFMLIAMFGLLSVLHPMAFLLLFATISPRIFIEGYTARRRFDLDMELTRNNRITYYFQSLLLERENVKEIKIFGLASYFVEKFFKYRDLLIKAYLRLSIHFLKVELVFDVLSMSGLCLVWLYAVYRASTGEITVGDLYMVFGAAQTSKDSIEAWFGQGGSVFENSLYLTRFFELVDLDPRTVDGALNRSMASPRALLPARLEQGIELKNVSFRYPGTDEFVLKDISFFIPASARLAIVGENGAGKTTLVKLLTRFYDPIDGSVCLDGKDYREYELDELRRGITVIFQDFAHYHFSVADNIGVGYVDLINDRTRIEQSAKNGGAHDMAMKLPNQYDTMLGRTYEEGVDLSGGEWQNVAISRAFMSDAQLFILDEPTAALDAFKESEVFDRFAYLTEGRTVVLVSHRFSTVRMADLICVIEDGRVIEYGSHEELVKLNGKYRRMYDAQAERYH